MFLSLLTPQIDRKNKSIPYILIIIPARNEEHRLPILLESLNKQSLKAYEITVIDDYSDDDTVGVAKGYGANVYKNTAINEVDSENTVACANGTKK